MTKCWSSMITANSRCNSAVVRFCLAGVPACDRPVLLLLLSDGTLLTYQAFHPPHQPLAFRRVPLDWTPHMTLTQEPPGPVPHPNAVQPTDRMQVSLFRLHMVYTFCGRLYKALKQLASISHSVFVVLVFSIHAGHVW